MKYKTQQGTMIVATANAKAGVKLKHSLEDIFVFECYDKNGNLKWVDTIENLVVDEGLTDNLQQYFKGSSYTAAHYVGLTGSSPTFASGDTMSSHSGWTEVTAYDETTRPQVQWDDASNKSIDNDSNKATFTIDTNSTTIGGAFICTDNTKGGNTGTLYGGGAFSAGDKTIDDDDTLNVKITATNSSS